VARQTAARDERQAALARAAARITEWEARRAEWSAGLASCPADQRVEVYRMLDVQVVVWAADPARRPAGATRWQAQGTLPTVGLPVVAFAAAPEAAGGAVVRRSPTRSPHNGTPTGLPLTWGAAA